MKRLLTVQDISCVGKCSLSVALPVISACGVETSVLPTALLSTHTAFEHFSFFDLTPRFSSIENAWKAEGLTFDALYSGYLGNALQVASVRQIHKDFCKTGGFLFVDPVMGDDGSLYSGFTPSFVNVMSALCAEADYIIPNISEACFLLQREYPEDKYSESDVKSMLKELTECGCRTAILTGVSFSPGRMGVMSFNKENNEYFYYDTEKLPCHFPGTGDVFASTVVGALLRGLPLERALECAAEFTFASMKATLEDPAHVWYGVNFESTLPRLFEMLKCSEEK